MLLEGQTTKSYVGPAGDAGFLERVWELVADRAVDAGKVVGIQTVGGSGALRLAADIVRRTGHGRIWVGVPTWPNHPGIFGSAGFEMREYPFFDVASQSVLFDQMVEALSSAEPGDVALLHASCHNPTGGPLTEEQWRDLTVVMANRGVVPLIDLAYQGFGRGLSEDVAGLRRVIAGVPEALVAVSSSKSFGLYRERTGAVFATTASPEFAESVRSHLVALARVVYSMPPDHGAAIVRTILEHPELRADWAAELEGMRQRIARLRGAIADAVGEIVPALRAVASQEGMFSLLPLPPERVRRLKDERGIYMPSSGRINIAGLREAEVSSVMAEVVRTWA